MPPDAEAAVSRGIRAAKQDHDYLLAIRYFQEARALVPVPPDAPGIFLNLGLAEAKLPGRELRAIGWLAAYLSTKPNATNEAAVREEIRVLGASNRRNLLHLIRVFQKEADQTRFSNPWLKSLAWADLARDQSMAGDVAGAREIFAKELGTAPFIQNVAGRSFAFSTIAEAQAMAAAAQAARGEVAGAKETFASALNSADSVEDTVLAQKGYTRAHIAKNQFAAGDLVGALQTAALIEDTTAKNFAMGFLPDALAWSQLTPAAEPVAEQSSTEATPLADETATMADLVLRHLAKIEAYRDLQAAAALMTEQVQAGWVAGDDLTVVVKRLDSLRTDAAATTIVKTPEGRVVQYSVSGIKVMDAGISAADLDKSIPYRSTIADAIAQNIMAGSPEEKTGDTLSRLLAWGHAINHTQPQAQWNISLAEWLARLDDSDPAGTCALNTPPFLDLAACLKGLPQSSDPEKAFEAPAGVIAKLAGAQAWIDKMLLRAEQQELDEGREESAEQQVKAGDFARAQEIADLIRDPAGRTTTQRLIDEARVDFVGVQARAGHFAGAQAAADLIRDENLKRATKAALAAAHSPESAESIQP